jgi:hypothetical protein
MQFFAGLSDVPGRVIDHRKMPFENFTATYDLPGPTPSASVEPNALDARNAISWNSFIRLIFGRRSRTKIGPTIVEWITVDMVDHAFRPMPAHIEKGQSARPVLSPINTDLPSIGRAGSGYIARV